MTPGLCLQAVIADGILMVWTRVFVYYRNESPKKYIYTVRGGKINKTKQAIFQTGKLQGTHLFFSPRVKSKDYSALCVSLCFRDRSFVYLFAHQQA